MEASQLNPDKQHCWAVKFLFSFSEPKAESQYYCKGWAHTISMVKVYNVSKHLFHSENLWMYIA